MELNSKLMELAKKASSAEEIVKLGAENGYSVTNEEAEKYLSLLKGNGPLSDDELDAVAGGKEEEKKAEEEKEKDPDPKYHRGQVLWLGFPTSQNYMEVIILEVEFYVKGKGWRYLVNGVQYGGKHSFYLETQEYVHTSDPGPIWIG